MTTVDQPSGPVDLDGRSLRYFLVLAEELNFTRAASQLHIAQQTLSDSVRQLERVVGVTLLDRSPRSVELTPAGIEFRRRAIGIVDDSVSAVLAARQAVRSAAGRLIVGTPDWQAGIAQFERALAHVGERDVAPSIEVSGLSWTSHLAAVLDRRIDLGVTFLPHGHQPPPGLEARILASERANWFLVADGHRLVGRDVVESSDLASTKLFLIRRSDNVALHDHLIGSLVARGVDPVVDETYSEGLSTAIVQAGLHGAALWVVRSMTEPIPIGIVAVEVRDLDAIVDLAVIWRAGERNGPIDMFVEALTMLH